MDKIELKHLAPYLSYGLKFKLLDYKCDYVGEKYGICNGFYFIGDGAYYTFKDRHTAGKNVNNCKPILRPLSNYTDINSSYVEDLGCDITDMITITELANREISLSQVPYGVIEIMCEQHLDFNRLIEKGLAIDINKL